MQTMVLAYFAAWGGVWAYVMWLGVENRRLQRRIDNLHVTKQQTAMERKTARAA